jgi:hypothetical protein
MGLTQEQRDLIHQEIDGTNTPVGSAEVRSLLEANPEARALATELRELAALVGAVPQRQPSPAVRQAALDALRPQPRVASEAPFGWVIVAEFVRKSLVQLRSATIRMEESMATKRTFLIGSSVVAAVAIIGFVVVGYPPNGREAGTIGGLPSDTIGGVQQASRYRSRPISASDVTIANPEIAVLFQNHEILTLVKSDVFRAAMSNDAFRSLQSNEAFRAALATESFRQLMSADAFRQLMASEAYRSLLASEAYRQLLASEAYHTLQAQDAFRAAQNTEAMRSAQNSEAYRALQANESFRQLLSSDAFRALQANDAFRAVMSNDALRAAMSSEAMRAAMSNDAFRAALANESFRKVMANDAFRQLNSSDAFRAVSRSAQLSDLFLSEAMRAQQQ